LHRVNESSAQRNAADDNLGGSRRQIDTAASAGGAEDQARPWSACSGQGRFFAPPYQPAQSCCIGEWAGVAIALI